MPEPSDLLVGLEPWVWEIPYNAACTPGAVPRSAWRSGANCQLFAYEVLAHFGLAVPDLYSSDLWHDREWTEQVAAPRALDLALFSGNNDSFGAHVGVVVGTDEVLHLCAEVGNPVIWTWADFTARDRYSVLIGCKRPSRPITQVG